MKKKTNFATIQKVIWNKTRCGRWMSKRKRRFWFRDKRFIWKTEKMPLNRVKFKRQEIWQKLQSGDLPDLWRIAPHLKALNRN